MTELGLTRGDRLLVVSDFDLLRLERPRLPAREDQLIDQFASCLYEFHREGFQVVAFLTASDFLADKVHSDYRAAAGVVAGFIAANLIYDKLDRREGMHDRVRVGVSIAARLIGKELECGRVLEFDVSGRLLPSGRISL